MIRHITDHGLRLIKTFEGLSLEPYKCIAGVWTIGYGHTGDLVTEDTPKITEQQAEDLLRHDVEKFEKAVLRLITRPLNDNQFDALVCFTFNVGAGNLQSSTLRAKCNRREDDLVPLELLKWNKARINGILQVSSGLTRRRAAEAGLYNLK